MTARKPKDGSQAGNVIAEATWIANQAKNLNSSRTSRQDAINTVGQCIKHTAAMLDELRLMTRVLGSDFPEWFFTNDLSSIPRPADD